MGVANYRILHALHLRNTEAFRVALGVKQVSSVYQVTLSMQEWDFMEVSASAGKREL